MTAKQLDALIKRWFLWLTSRKHRNRSRASKAAWQKRKAAPKLQAVPNDNKEQVNE